MGFLLGWVAWRTGSVLPGILIHLTNNAMSVSMERILASEWGGAELILKSTEQGPQYQTMWIVASIFIAASCLAYFASLKPAAEESEADLLDVDHDYIDPTKSLAAIA